MDDSRQQYFHTAALMFCLAATAVLYIPGLTGGYFFDDAHVLQQNPYLRLQSLDFFSLIRSASSFGPGGRELSMTTFALNFYFFGESTWWLKVVNLAIHCLNGLCLYALFLQLVRIVATGSDRDHTGWGVVVVGACALWLVHPVNLSSVLYISQRMAQLSTLCMLLGLMSYVWVRTQGFSGWRQVVYPPLILLAFTALGFKAKENAILLPVYAFIVELAVLRFRSDDRTDRFIVAMYAAGAALILAFVAYKFWANPGWITNGYRSRYFTLDERVMTQFRALVYYLGEIVSPSNSTLSLWHDDFRVSRSLLDPATTLLSLVVLVGLLAAAFVLLGKMPLVALGILWYFVSHSIESTIFSLELVHEHRNYLASFGILLALVALLYRLAGSRKAVFNGACLVLFVFYAVVLGQRAAIWGDDFRHARHEALNHPNSGIANFELAKHYYLRARGGNAESEQLAYQYGLLAMEKDKYTIVPEMFLVVLSLNTEVAYRSEWFQMAAKKLEKYPYMAPSKKSFKDLVFCILGDICEVPIEDIRPLVEVAYGTGQSQLATTAGIYFQNAENDPKKAEKAFRRAFNKRSSPTWINYIYILTINGKHDQACKIYLDFRSRYESGEFKNISLYIESLAKIESGLRNCPGV